MKTRKTKFAASLAAAALAGTAFTPVAHADNIGEIAMANSNFETLVAAAKAANLVPVLTSKGPITVFAPTDAAFDKLPAGTVEKLLKPENRERLKTILSYHVVPGRVTANKVMMLPSGTNVETASGEKIIVRLSNGVRIDPGVGTVANVTQTDINADNGVIHVIDEVLIPPSVQRRMAYEMKMMN